MAHLREDVLQTVRDMVKCSVCNTVEVVILHYGRDRGGVGNVTME